ncbi:MAG: adenylate/guanylate cyclase protein [Magnetococcales bacterium]|nr:adenylate/guanylate cyclase protein [Magnetococcales bacterium]HIJ82889.1 adenylate/guanylate cyclase domain-containing protein [Magnetococcales bacterium]
MAMISEEKSANDFFDKPFPLKTLFRRWFIPAVLGFCVIFLALIGFVSLEIVESIYLEMAQRRAQTIAKSVAMHAPLAWESLMQEQSTHKVETSPDAVSLIEAFATEVGEMDLLEIKVYGLDRRVRFATYRHEIGMVEDGPALSEVLRTATPSLVRKTGDDGSHVYELYVPVFDEAGTLRAVFELYEPVGYLDDILAEAVVLTLIIPGILLFAMVLALNKLVNQAQTHIDARTREANELRRKVESFVSSTAARAAKMAGFGGKIPSRNMTTTLFFSDIRDFSGFSEKNSPEAVVDFLNQIMTLQVALIQRHGGDVDKMIGDAILARFDAQDGHHQAIVAAREILHAVKKQNYPRTLGIGVFRGQVISGAIGPEDRRDFTVIGDAVNVASRLCGAAKADELVTDATLAGMDFGPAESIHVKGRVQPVVVRRWKVFCN